MRRIWLAIWLGCATATAVAPAQQVSGPAAALSGQGGGGGSASRTDSPGFQDIFGSIGRACTEWLRESLGLRTGGRMSWDSNESPRHALLSFTTGMDEILREGGTDYRRVTQTLPEGYGVDSAEVRALKGVLDRLAPLNPVNFPDTTASSGKATLLEFEVFPYAVNHEWVWERLGRAPEGEIHLKREPGEDAWRFSEATLKGAPALLNSVRDLPPVYPVQVHKDILRSVFQPMGDETPWWGWGLLAASLALAVAAGKGVKVLFLKSGDRLETHTRPLVGAIVRSIGTSMAILAGTVVFIIGGSFVHFTQIFSDLYWELIQAILLVAVLWAFLGAADLASTLLKNRVKRKRDDYGAMTVTIVHRAVNTVLLSVLVIFLLENVFSLNIGALITGLGIVGLAVSLAGKESAQNLFGAISIFTNRPFVVGDWVEFKGNVGEVHDVRMQATYIRLLSGEMMIVPNMQFVSNEVENLGMRKYLRREMDVALPYGTPPEKIKKAIEVLEEVLGSEEVAKEGNFDLEERPASVSFSDFGEYYLNLKVYYWYFIGENGNVMQRNHERGWFTYLTHCTLVNLAILEAFAAHDIEFAFPTETLNLEWKRGNPPRVASGTDEEAEEGDREGNRPEKPEKS